MEWNEYGSKIVSYLMLFHSTEFDFIYKFDK